jgi:heme/copper-type cytochrome/quinol oxidase subunit 2
MAAPRNFTNRDHRRLIGYLGILLPVLLYGLAAIRPTQGLLRWELLGSISAYYYTGAVALFTGVLLALSLFLFTYRGYEGERPDRILGAIGGACALLVALFPTRAPANLTEPDWWSPTAGVIHYLSAVLLFVVFIAFSLWLFRKSSIPDPKNRPPDKNRRNSVYLWCGIIMIGAVLWAGSSYFTKGPIFWPEAIALWAFAISWLVKGEAHEPVVRAVRRVWSRE